MPIVPDMRDVEVIAPHFKRRLSGVTSTVIQLVPVQNRHGQKVATLGPGLPDTLPKMRWRDLLSLWAPPRGKPFRIWHARRNLEMLPGILMRDVLGMKLKLVFTSASQRRHTGWTKFLISKMDAVIATSAKTAAYLDVPSTVVMHGIDTERFSPPADKALAKIQVGLEANRHYAGCFGRVRHQKGTDLFVDSMISLLPDRPDWSAVIAGRAAGKHQAFEDELRARVAQAGLADRILFVGEHTNINDWYRALDLFVAPQRWEGFGLTPLEAMASGIPVVAADVGAFKELLVSDQINYGRLFVPASVDDLIKAASTYMNDESERRKNSERSLARARTVFSIESEALKLEEIYDAIISQHQKQAMKEGQ